MTFCYGEVYQKRIYLSRKSKAMAARNIGVTTNEVNKLRLLQTTLT